MPQKTRSYSFATQTINIEIDDENGKKHMYELRTPSGETRGQYVDMRTDAVQVDGMGRIRGYKVGRMPVFLVSRCLREIMLDEQGNPLVDQSGNKQWRALTEAELGRWPGDIVEQLFQDALDLGNLRGKDNSLVQQIKDLVDHPNSGCNWDKLKELLASDEYQGPEFAPLRSLFDTSSLEDEAANF